MKKYILLMTLFLLVGCGGQESSDVENVSDKINEYLGVTPYLPELDYPIGLAHIEYKPKFEDGEPVRDEPWNATVIYYASKDNPLDEEATEDWKKGEPLIEIIYGDLYMDPSAVQMRIYTGGPGSFDDAETFDIDGHEVQYQHTQEGTEQIFMLIGFEDIGYEIRYFAEEDDIKAEAKALAKEIINNTK